MSKDTPNGWVSAFKTKNRPAYLRNTHQTFWWEYDSTHHMMYAQINQIRDTQEKSLKQFAQELVNEITRQNAQVLVLDLRLNNGGNGMLNRDFLLEIIKCETINQPSKLFTIIGRKTFSAALMLATKLDEYTETVFIGEPTGGKPSHVGDDNIFVLPYSGVMASAAMTYWQSPVSYDDRGWIAPDIYVPFTSQEYAEGQDPVMKKLIELIAR